MAANPTLPDDFWPDHREEVLMGHLRFAADMDAALAEIAERQEPKPECPMCRGYGWHMVTDERRPWNECRVGCECCT